MRRNNIQTLDISEFTVPAFGYELIRYDLLDELLGEDAPGLLYWAGKRLARKYPLFSVTEICEFFSNAGWGTLELKNEKKSQMEFTLSSDLIEYRMNTKTKCSYQLEAGFLAEQIQQQKDVYAECFEDQNKKHVILKVQWEEK